MAQFSGAFDLSQVSSSAQAGVYFTEVTPTSFEATLRKSVQYPIVLEFYSQKAPESDKMGQILKSLANAGGGGWLLGRMNIDTAPQIAQALQIRAVPMVVGVLSGQMVPLWQGSVTKEDAEKAIGELLKLAAGNGILGRAEPQQGQDQGDATPDEDPYYKVAYDAMEQSDFPKALAEFEKLLASNPGDTLARIGKAQAGLLIRAAKLDPLQVLARLQSDPDDLDTILDAADLDVAMGEAERGFARLTTAISILAGDDRDRLRTRLLELFDTQDPSDKVVLTARRNLATALF